MNSYRFEKEDAYSFAKLIGAKYSVKNGEMKFVDCPYCHGAGHGDKGTFSINLSTGQFKCLRSSCNAKGNMITLAKDFGFVLSNGTEFEEPQNYKEFPDVEIQTRPGAIEYLESRGISAAVCKEYELTTDKNNASTLVFPFKDETGKLQLIKYRNMKFEKGKSKGSKEWTEANSKPILFGMNHCNFDNKTLVITEGQMDSLSCIEAGVENAVSVPLGALGFTWVPNCWDFLCKFDTLVVFGDHEKGHITLLDELAQRFDGIVKHVREDDYLDCKDANELLQKHGKLVVKRAVEKSIIVENPHIKSLADVARVDLNQIKHFSTGFPRLDNYLSGGFYDGQLIILTGERGKGKSTFASMIAAHAIRQRITTFMYSGEMLDWQVKDWLEHQIAGGSRINTRTINNAAGSYQSFLVDQSYDHAITEFYQPYTYVYEAVRDDAEKLLETLKNAITKYGCKFLIVDNLMTAMDDDLASDIYRQQTEFTKQLSILAHRFNVVIMLIAHPKKVGDGKASDWQNDDILGSSNITNLADIVMRYDRPKKGEPTERCLCITKNRLTGRLILNKDLPLYYQESTRRIVDCPADFNVDLMVREGDTVCHTENGMEFTVNDEELPF